MTCKPESIQIQYKDPISCATRGNFCLPSEMPMIANGNVWPPPQIHLKLLLVVQYPIGSPPSVDDCFLCQVCQAPGALLGQIHPAEQLAGFPGCASDMEFRRWEMLSWSSDSWAKTCWSNYYLVKIAEDMKNNAEGNWQFPTYSPYMSPILPKLTYSALSY